MTATRSVHYDRAGRPISFACFRFLHEDRAYIQIALTHIFTSAVEPDFIVSTVWTGTSVGCSAHAPVVFESAISCAETEDDYLERYASEREAIIGHAFFVKDIIRKLGQEGLHTITVDMKPWVSLIKADR